MTLAEDLKGLLYGVRSIPGQLGLRPHKVWLLKRSWSGQHTGAGTRTDVEFPITEGGKQAPKVRWLSDEEIAVGSLAAGTVEVGPITPSHKGGGTDLSILDGSTFKTGEVRHLWIQGPQHPKGAAYRITRIGADHALHYTLQASPAGTT